MNSYPELRRVILGLFCLWFTCAGCGTADSARTDAGQSVLQVPGLTIDAEWVRERLSRSELVVVDARPPAEYAAGHIPGAVNLPRKLTYATDASGIDKLPPIGQIEELFSTAGIDSRTAVVVYDDKDYRDASRLLWTLEVHGHRNVAVLNGGFSHWKGQGFPASTEVVQPVPRNFTATLQPEFMASKLHVLRGVDRPEVTILDVRSEDEYLGRKTETTRAGHIPSARHVDFRAAMRTDGGLCYFLDVEQLKSAYAGIPADNRVITYCNTGARASVSYLALRLLGRNVAIYDGAWSEWSADPALPIATKVAQ